MKNNSLELGGSAYPVAPVAGIFTVGFGVEVFHWAGVGGISARSFLGGRFRDGVIGGV